MSAKSSQTKMQMPSNLSALRTYVWSRPEEFEELREEWNRLAALSSGHSIFARHEWFDAAWQWRRESAQLWLHGVYRGDELVGIAPLVLETDKSWGLSTRKVTFLTIPDTQHCGILASPEELPAVITALVQALYETNAQWDFLDFSHLPAEESMATDLHNALQNVGLKSRIVDQGTNPGIAITEDWQTYYGRRSRRLKKGNNLIANRLQRNGHNASLEHIGNVDHRQAQATLEVLIRVSSESWKAATGVSLDFPGPNAFIRRLTEHALEQGWLSLWRLDIDGQPAAMEYQLRYNRRIHALRADFDENFVDFSPGTYLNWQMLERLFDQDAEEYLMGPGENAYKLRWAETFKPLIRIQAYSPSFQGRLRALRDLRLKPLARRVRDRIKPSKMKGAEA